MKKLHTACGPLRGPVSPADDVSLYLSTLVSQDPETWDSLVDAL